jgi:hypothetical protein
MAAALAALALSAMPLAAAEEPPTAESRLGVVMAALCGISVRYALVAPTPIATAAAIYTCGFTVLDALATPDEPVTAP